MLGTSRGRLFVAIALALPVGLAATGCHTPPSCDVVCKPDAPYELKKVNHLPYVIEPPDIIIVDALRTIPLPPYRVEPLDKLRIAAEPNGLPTAPVSGDYTVDPEGKVVFHPRWKSIVLVGMTLEEAKKAVSEHLRKEGLKGPPGEEEKPPRVDIELIESRALQQVRGEHLVRPDGTIALGTYGNVNVTGLTLEQAKGVIEEHLSKFLLNPEVTVDVGAFNSKVYYVVFDGAGLGEQVTRFPATGNETVFDALAQTGGLPGQASKYDIWVARYTTDPAGCGQKLPVNWRAIAECAQPNTNYQIFPGDRIYVRAKPAIAFNNAFNTILAPIERAVGLTFLGQSVYYTFRNNGAGFGTPFGIGGFGGFGGFGTGVNP